MTDEMKILTDCPAYIVIALPEDHNILLTNDKEYCRTSIIPLRIRKFKNSRYEFLNSFTIGADDQAGVWAYGRGSILSDGKQMKDFCVGADIGDIIRIEGKKYRIDEAPNQNIKFTEV